MTSAEQDCRPAARRSDCEYDYRRSAALDRRHADALSWDNPRKDEFYDSATRKEDKAYHLMLKRVGAQPTLTELRRQIGNESWLAALALLDLSSQVARDAARFTQWSRDGGRYTPTSKITIKRRSSSLMPTWTGRHGAGTSTRRAGCGPPPKHGSTSS